MKKFIKKVFADISAVTLMTTAMTGVFSGSAEWDFGEYNTLDDKGMFAYSNEVDYQMCYEISTNGVLYLCKYIPLWNRFEFELSNRVDKEEVRNRVLEIVKQYCPDAEIAEGQWGDNRYSVYVTTQAYADKDDEVIQKGLKNQEKVFSALVEENLISKFYKMGDICQKVDIMTGGYRFEYLLEDDSEQLESAKNYLEENNTGCVMEKEESSFFDAGGYVLKPEEEMEYEQFFTVATDLYELTGICPVVMSNDVYCEAFGENAFRKYVLENQTELSGDANNDNELNVRDCACIASAVAENRTIELGTNADFNKDDIVNIRDAAFLANYIVTYLWNHTDG